MTRIENFILSTRSVPSEVAPYLARPGAGLPSGIPPCCRRRLIHPHTGDRSRSQGEKGEDAGKVLKQHFGKRLIVFVRDETGSEDS
jgi:hypothetical protein